MHNRLNFYDKQKIILEAIKDNIINRFCSLDDCKIHFRDILNDKLTLNTPFHVIKSFHSKHHIDMPHSHSSSSSHVHIHTNDMKEDDKLTETFNDYFVAFNKNNYATF